MTTTTYPNGQVLTSTALTQQQMNILVQAITCGMLGIVPVDPAAVRVDWQPQGQPATALPTQDICYVTAVTEHVPYSEVRDHTVTGDASAPVTETWVYTRGWRFTWQLEGANATDRARQIHSAVLQSDYFYDQLSAANVYALTDPHEPVRVPVEHNAQWYDSSQFSCLFYEQVTETIQTRAVTSVEIKVYDGSVNDPIADITATS